MKHRALHIRFAMLQLASLLYVSASCAAAAGSEGPSGFQPRTSGRTNSLLQSAQSAFQPKIGATASRPSLELRLPAPTKSLDGYPSAPSRTRSDSGSQAPSTFQLSFGKSRSSTEEFVNRVHHEGLPLARLWENKSALVSLGLNQKGHAGLWLIQKTP